MADNIAIEEIESLRAEVSELKERMSLAEIHGEAPPSLGEPFIEDHSESSREIDGSIDNVAGVDVSDTTDLLIDVYHRSTNVSLSQAISNSTTYWLKVDLSEPNTGSASNACSIVTTDPGGSGVLSYKLMTVDADGKALLSRAAWTEYDGTNIDIRFDTVTTPDVPSGTRRFWNSTTPPLGWSLYSPANPYIAMYTGSGDYATEGGTLGQETTDLYFNHDHFLGSKVDITEGTDTTATILSCFARTDGLSVYSGQPENWSGTGSVGVNYPDDTNHMITIDHRPPTEVMVMIERD